MKNSWAGKTLVLSFSFLVKYFSSGGPWEGYTAIFKSKGCLSAGSKRNRSFIGYMWPCQRIFTGQRHLPASFTQFTIKPNTEMALLLRAQHSQHQPGQTTAAQMVHHEMLMSAHRSDNGPNVPLCWQSDAGLQGNFVSHIKFIRTLSSPKCHLLSGKQDLTMSGMASQKI